MKKFRRPNSQGHASYELLQGLHAGIVSSSGAPSSKELTIICVGLGTARERWVRSAYATH